MAVIEENTAVKERAKEPVKEVAPARAPTPVTAQRIDRVEISHHRLPLDPPFPAAWDSRPRENFDMSVVRVTTADGLTGIGSGTALEGIEDYLGLFTGRDPLDLERHQAVLANIDFHGCRPWPLDIALWDLAGKIRGEPVWRMLGGESGRVACYASTGTLRDRAAMVDRVVQLADQGFPAVKIRFHRDDWRDDIAVVEAVRAAVGTRIELIVDCNQGWRMPWDTTPCWSYHQALVVARELEQFGVYWMEEPVHRGDTRGMAALCNAVKIRIAAGEMTREECALNDLVERRCVDVLQPDATLTCGIWGLMRVAALAADHEVAFTPHTWGNGIGLLANAHLFAGCGGGPWLEYPFDPPEWLPERRDFALNKPVKVDGDGNLTLSDAPGFGLDLDEAKLAACRID